MRCSNIALFDDLVGAGEEWRRHGEAESLCSIEVDYELKPSWLFNRNIAGLCSAQNPVGELGRARK